MARIFLFLSFILSLGFVSCGFRGGEACHENNTALLYPKCATLPPVGNIIKCADMRNMSTTPWYTHRNILGTVTDIIADNMRLKKIPRKVIASMPYLELLHVTRNSIRHVHPLMFKHNPKFRTLIMTNNKVVMSNKRPFLISQSLTTLFLNKNHIKTIPLVAFTKMPLLRELFLCSNELTALNPYIFKNLEYLKLLHIENNLLKKIPPKNMLPKSLKAYTTKYDPENFCESIDDLD